MHRPTTRGRLIWALSFFILWICSVPTLALPSTPYPWSYRSEPDARTPSQSSGSLHNHTLLQKRADGPSYSEANYIWEEASNHIFGVAKSEDQFQNTDKAYAKLELSTQLGSGSYGTVFDATLTFSNNDPKQEGAAKQSNDNGQVAVNGANLEKSINSKFVTEVYEVFWQPSNDKSIIMMEKLTMDVDSTLRDIASNMDQYQGLDYRQYTESMMVAAFIGLRDTHAAGVAHRDIKPENMMFDECGDGYKLIDYDHAIKNDVLQAGNHGTAVGSPLYQAPGKI